MSAFGFPEPRDQSQGLGRVATLQGVAGRTGYRRCPDHGARGGRFRSAPRADPGGTTWRTRSAGQPCPQGRFSSGYEGGLATRRRVVGVARNAGYATADDSALDCDVILAAQALLVAEDGFEVIVATRNVGHLGRFVDAREWQTITTDRPGGMPLP